MLTIAKIPNILVKDRIFLSFVMYETIFIPLLADLQDERYAQGRGFITKAVNGCHTSSLTTPEDKEQAQQIHVSPTSNANDCEIECRGRKREEKD